MAAKTTGFKLTYFDGQGRAELTRLIFAKSGTKYEDERLGFDEWEKQKESVPMSTLPILQHDGQKLFQSVTIARYAARKCKLVGRNEWDEFFCDMFVSYLFNELGLKLFEILIEQDEERQAALMLMRTETLKEDLPKLEAMVKGNFVLGNVMSYADLAIFDFETLMKRVLPDYELPAKLKAISEKVKADTAIAAYLAKRPESHF